MKKLLEYLKQHGGKIVSSNDLSPEWIEQARDSKRMWVDENGFGFIWEPPISDFPTTLEEVEQFEKWYPNKIELPEDLKTPDKLFEIMRIRKQEREN